MGDFFQLVSYFVFVFGFFEVGFEFFGASYLYDGQQNDDQCKFKENKERVVKRNQDQFEKNLEDGGGKVYQDFGYFFLYGECIKKVVDQFWWIKLDYFVQFDVWYMIGKIKS